MDVSGVQDKLLARADNGLMFCHCSLLTLYVQYKLYDSIGHCYQESSYQRKCDHNILIAFGSKLNSALVARVRPARIRTTVVMLFGIHHKFQAFMLSEVTTAGRSSRRRSFFHLPESRAGARRS